MTGLYDLIGIPFGYLMRLIYAIFKNYAVSIIVFTIITRLLMFPVSYSTQKNSARMTLLNPKLEKLKKSFASNPQRLQEEQQKLYQEEGINPMASCLPTFIQMFLLFGVLDVVYKPLTHILDMSRSIINAAMGIAGLDPSKTGLRGELKIMEDIAVHKSSYSSLGENFADKVYDFNEKFTIFGANLGKTPSLHPETWNKEAVILAAIPFLAGLAQLLYSVYTQMHQKKVNPAMQQAGGGYGHLSFLSSLPSLSISTSLLSVSRSSMRRKRKKQGSMLKSTPKRKLSCRKCLNSRLKWKNSRTAVLLSLLTEIKYQDQNRISRTVIS